MAQNPVIVITSPPPVASPPANAPPMSDITQELSAMDLHRGPEDPVSPQSATSDPEPSHSWRNLRRKALENRGASSRPHVAPTKERNYPNQQNKSERIKQLYQVVSSSTAAPKKRQKAIRDLARGGHISELEEEKLNKRNVNIIAARADRKEACRVMKSSATSKAKQVARTKALERALGNLELEVASTKPKEENSSAPPLLLSLAHAKHILGNTVNAETSFGHLQLYQHEASSIGRLPQKDHRRLKTLRREEESLQAKAREAGSIEAALSYQDQRVAYLDEIFRLRQDSFASDEQIQNPRARSYEEGLDYPLKCVCGFQHDEGKTIFCEHCMTWQHIECYYFDGGRLPDASEIDHYCVGCKPRRLDIGGATSRQTSRHKQALLRDNRVERRSRQREAKTSERNYIAKLDRAPQANEPHDRPKLYDSYRPAHDARNTSSSRSSRQNSAVFTPLLGGGDYYHSRPIRPLVLHNSPSNTPSHSGGSRLIDSYRPSYNTQQPPVDQTNRAGMANVERKIRGSSGSPGPPHP
ncbi:MAG: hypothetical protein Q9208_007349 [Pyrenodesmia sp. 3 TL-2023]